MRLTIPTIILAAVGSTVATIELDLISNLLTALSGLVRTFPAIFPRFVTLKHKAAQVI